MPAISSGSPIRRSGEKEVNLLKTHSGSWPNILAMGLVLFTKRGVLMAPGQITLQRMFEGPYSTAAACVKAISPPLAAV